MIKNKEGDPSTLFVKSINYQDFNILLPEEFENSYILDNNFQYTLPSFNYYA